MDSLHKAKHPIIVVGSSYGASIASRLAMDHSELVDGLVFTEKPISVSLLLLKLVRTLFIPRIFRPANTEKVHHKKELEKMLLYWKNIRVPVYYLQGANDDIVDTSNAGFAKEQLINVPSLEIKFLPNRKHLLARYEWQAIKQAILNIYDKAKKE